jgi:Ca2+-binding EF-hand superfamily protein
VADSFSLSLLCCRARFLHERQHEEKMIQLAFEYFDKDDSGYITSDEFLQAMSELGDPLTEQEVGTFLKHFDVDSDGKVGRVCGQGSDDID